MYQNKLLYIAFIIVFILRVPYLYAQDETEDKSDCVLNLEKAQQQYDKGRIQDVEPLISKCLKNNEYEKIEKVQALKLLTLAYLFLEEPEQAEETMLTLLNTNHEFTTNPAIDPSEFINLYEKFRHDPLYNIGILGGVTLANPIVTKLNSTQNLNNSNRPSYTPLLSFSVGAYIEYEFKNRFYINGGLSFKNLSFKKNSPATKPITNSSNGGFEGRENQSYIDLPLWGQYHIMENKGFTLYAGLGVAPQFLLSASFPGDAMSNAVEGSADATSNTISVTADRNRFNAAGIALAGVKLKAGEGYVNFQIKYGQQFLQNTKDASALTPENSNMVWDLSNATDGFRLHTLQITLGYTKNFYVPKKLR